jgi:hypothetical protein
MRKASNEFASSVKIFEFQGCHFADIGSSFMIML